jgi:hypothetical protein
MKTWYSILFFIAAAIGISSCKNNDNVFKPVVSSFLNVVNATGDTLNYFINGTRQNNASSMFPGGYTLYLPVPAGTQNYQFKKSGSPIVLFGLPLTLKDSTYNSLYITGETAGGAFHIVDTLLVDTALNMCTIRFVNASPDAGNLNVTVGDTVNFKNRPFKSCSAFAATGSGRKEVKIYQTGNNTAKVDTTITFQPNKAYTLFSKGLLNGTGNSKFNVGVIRNTN